MSKINISKPKYKFLDENLTIYKNKNIITENQYKQITDLYNIKYINPIQIFTILGAMLIGLGVIIYIGSNWNNIDNIFKLSIIILIYLITNLVSYKTSNKYKRTSKSILYLGILIYGAGVMLTQNMFNYNVSFMPSGLFWILGILPTVYIFEEEAMYIFTCILTLMFSFLYIQSYPYMLLVVYLLIYFVGRNKFSNFTLGILAREIVLFSLIPQYLDKYGLKDIYILLIMLGIGIGIRNYKFKKNKIVYELLGLVLIGVCGISLTFSEIWATIFIKDISTVIAYGVALSYFIYFIYQSVKGNLICILPIIALVIRYFSDSLLLSFSKSLLFIIVGGILLAIGFYIEKNINNKRM